MQHNEAPDLGGCQVAIPCQVLIDFLDVLADQIIDFVTLREIGITGITQTDPLGKISHCFEINVNENGHVVSCVTKGHCLPYIGKEL